jgi:hypothetical protein
MDVVSVSGGKGSTTRGGASSTSLIIAKMGTSLVSRVF